MVLLGKERQNCVMIICTFFKQLSCSLLLRKNNRKKKRKREYEYNMSMKEKIVQNGYTNYLLYPSNSSVSQHHVLQIPPEVLHLCAKYPRT